MPPGFLFPQPLTDLSESALEGVFWHSLRCLVKKSALQPGLMEFLQANLPSATQDAQHDYNEALRRIPRAQPLVSRRTAVIAESSTYKIFTHVNIRNIICLRQTINQATILT